MWNVPTIEDIYNEFHKQTFFVRNGVYPRRIQNFKKLYNDQRKMAYLNHFITFLKRNTESVDWKIYILALSKVLGNRFELKHLGSFGANKIYRDYVKMLQLEKNSDEAIYNDIVNSLQFLIGYLKANEYSFNDYLKIDESIIPVALKHIYAGTISLYFYACFPLHVLNKWFDYPNDIFEELFKSSKNDFFENLIVSKRNKILTNTKIQKLILKLEEKFNKYF